MLESPSNRRNFLRQTSIAGVGLLAPLAAAQQKPADNDKAKGDEGISPAEDLMREHGVLNRVLLIYDEHLRMMAEKRPFDGSVLVNAADIIRHFVEEYHEKLEEDFLFPRFRKAGKLVGLVDTLQAQHKAGRELTAKIRELAAVATLKYVSSDSDKLADALQAFLHMYRPHEAREDTVLFPAFRSIVSAHEYDALGDDFEKKEDELFGDEGFFKVVDQVAQLEKKLGIYELAQFTPK
ncbi:MAG TPA: hemerythrin domain-containing protein [Candidatus Dormibacteraeota bacterium]|nr:hemerythrin domain-containing protein [Candidatus Dormibacteraeota bacterium]